MDQVPYFETVSCPILYGTYLSVTILQIFGPTWPGKPGAPVRKASVQGKYASPLPMRACLLGRLCLDISRYLSVRLYRVSKRGYVYRGWLEMLPAITNPVTLSYWAFENTFLVIAHDEIVSIF